MVDEPKIEQAPIHVRLAPKDTYRILIMDSVENADLLKEACKDVGFSVAAAHTIKEAFAFLDGANHADVIICAAYLEDESLFEFLKRLRLDPLHEDTMFCALALAPGPMGIKVQEYTEKAGRLLGADAFLSMPAFDAPLLIQEIKKLLPSVPVLEQERKEEEAP